MPNRQQPLCEPLLTFFFNADFLSTRHLGRNLNEIRIKMPKFFQEILFESVIWKTSAIFRGPQCGNKGEN